MSLITGNKKRLLSAPSTRPIKRPCTRTGLTIKYCELQALLFAAKHIPERIPMRWEAVSRFVSDTRGGESDETPFNIELPALQTNHGVFCSTPEACKKTFESISACLQLQSLSKDSLERRMCCYPEKNVLKPLVLFPPVKECCGSQTHIRNRPCFPLVYTSNGTYVAAMYNSKCRHCTKKFHVSFYEDGDQTFFYDPNDGRFFQVTSQTVFEVALLDNITNNVCISATSFESRAEVYNENFRRVDSDLLGKLECYGRTFSDQDHPWKLNEKRVEDAWFLFALVSFYKRKGSLQTIDFTTVKAPSQRVDVDDLCKSAWIEITSSPSPWIHHRCKKVGCAEGKVGQS